jgi:2-polyprenyl-6-methoxyphenol hydroxylase-like FAD-dependent oxidoreductase
MDYERSEQLPSGGCVHVIGAGPVGLMLTALLQSVDGCSVRLYERRPEYTRTRMVRLAPYLVADSLESYRTDSLDGENIEALFDRDELGEALAFRQRMPFDLFSLLRGWTQGFCPLNDIERSLSNLIDARPQNGVQRISTTLSVQDTMEMLGSDDIVIDCTGARSLLRDHLVPRPEGGVAGANTDNFRLEHAIVVTFLFGRPYTCNELCKYYKNVDNKTYKFIPAVDRTALDGEVTHVTGIVVVSDEDYAAMPTQFDGQWLRDHFPSVATSMDHFIEKIRQETEGEILGALEIVRIPMNLYHARNATSRRWRSPVFADHPFARTPVFLVGDSAIGSPYFQSISLGFECAMYLAGLLAQRNLSIRDTLDRYELLIYKQWLRVYMRSRMIKHNKDLFESLDDTLALLGKLHIY